MKKMIKYSKQWEKQIRSMRYMEKRRSKKWKNRKKNIRATINRVKILHRRNDKATESPYKKPEVPKNFSFINNTDEMVYFLNYVKKIYRSKMNIEYDLAEVDFLTSDAIGILVATITDKDITGHQNSRGRAPEKIELRKIFLESGMDEHVTVSYGFEKNKNSSVLHREAHMKVKPEVAKQSVHSATKHIYGEKRVLEPLYNTLIECMSNTSDHANPKKNRSCYWCLHTHNDPETGNSCFTFIDLGVGIFESKYVHGYIRTMFEKTIKQPNIKLVEDLLEGKINSRMIIDKEIRGKGLSEIVSMSQETCCKKFYIITNDVKINVKERKGIQLDNNFSGTVLYWELGS